MLKKLSSQSTRRAGKAAAVVLAAALALTGCSGGDAAGKASETTLTMSQGGAATTVTYYAEGDNVTKQTTENVVDYEASGIADRDEAEKTVGGLVDQYKGIKGVDHSIEFGDTELTETVTITYADLDVAKLAEATGADTGQDPEDARKVSLKEAVKTLTDAGFTEVE